MIMDLYIKIGACILLLIISVAVICSIILPLFEDLSELKDRKKDVIAYINTCLSTNRKLDLDAVLITIKSMLETTSERKNKKYE